MNTLRPSIQCAALILFLLGTPAVLAQVPPSASEKAGYTGLLLAASQGNTRPIKETALLRGQLNITDAYGRTPLHVAAYEGHHAVMQQLAEAGANLNALENDRYDIVTIAAVANDKKTLRLALKLGASAKNITSRYDGTALIAAAHLGHVDIVKILIQAGAPLDHINNLGWTAVIEAIVLGDGGNNHTETLRALIQAGADITITDRNGRTPYELASELEYSNMVNLLQNATEE